MMDLSYPVTFTSLIVLSGPTRNSTAEYGRLSDFGAAVIRIPPASAWPWRFWNSLSKFSVPSRNASGARRSSVSLNFICSARFSSGVYSHSHFPSEMNNLPGGCEYAQRIFRGFFSSSRPLSVRRIFPGGVYTSVKRTCSVLALLYRASTPFKRLSSWASAPNAHTASRNPATSRIWPTIPLTRRMPGTCKLSLPDGYHYSNLTGYSPHGNHDREIPRPGD